MNKFEVTYNMRNRDRKVVVTATDENQARDTAWNQITVGMSRRAQKHPGLMPIIYKVVKL
jgi:hypothetical protein